MSDTNKKLDANMAAMMYYQIDKLFGAGSQLFTMEYSGRTLNRLDYAYPIEDYNSSSLLKPYVVAEKEFRLCDNMLDLSPIVQGPNGSNLSVVYNTAINNYTPKLENVKDFVTDKMELRLFLMEKITDEIDGELITCSRMEFCQRTYLRYLEKSTNGIRKRLINKRSILPKMNWMSMRNGSQPRHGLKTTNLNACLMMLWLEVSIMKL